MNNRSRIPKIGKSIECLLSSHTALQELIIAKCRYFFIFTYIFISFYSYNFYLYIYFYYIRGVTDSHLSKLSLPPLCTSITSLDIATLRISENVLLSIATNCTNLQVLCMLDI